MYTCSESYLPVEKTDILVWDWVHGLISDDAKLTKGLANWQKQNKEQMEPRRARLAVLDELINRAERSVTRLATAYRKAETEVEAVALERERKIAAREWEALSVERDHLKAELAEVELTPERESFIRQIAQVVKERLGKAGLVQKRDVIDLLNFSAQLGYNSDGQRGLWCTCAITPSPKFLEFDNHSSAARCG